MSVIEFSWLCASITASILIAIFMVPAIRRTLILQAFGAEPKAIRTANIVHRAAGGVAGWEVFTFPILAAPRLAVALVNAVGEASRRNPSYTAEQCREAWAAWVMFHTREARRLPAREAQALIVAFTFCRSVHPEVASGYIRLVQDDALAGAGYLLAVRDIEKAEAGWRAGVSAEYAALI
jgi:hypothetical protein